MAAAELSTVFLFRGWPEADLRRVERMARNEIHARGHVLFQQDAACASLYVLHSGRVQMYRLTPDGREVTLHMIGPGALVGCAALFLDRAFPASARVVSETAQLLAIRGGPFLELLDTRPDLARRMIGTLAGRLTELAGRIESQAADSAPARLAGWLLEQPSRSLDGPGQAGRPRERIVTIEGSKKALASALGMTPETFSRCLRAFSDADLLRVDGNEVTIVDAAGLVGEAEGG